MEKIEETEEVVYVAIHKFYCDKCEKFLGKSSEYCDGDYYETIGEYKSHLFFAKRWWKKDILLCDSCKLEFEKEFNEMLQKFGYELDSAYKLD